MKTRIKHRRHEVTGTTEHSFSDPQDPFSLSFYELIPRGAFIKSVKIQKRQDHLFHPAGDQGSRGREMRYRDGYDRFYDFCEKAVSIIFLVGWAMTIILGSL